MFFLRTEKELLEVWKDTAEIFQQLKNSREIYSPDMDKNTMCIYCLKVSEEDYYQLGVTGTISELGRKVGRIEEDLDYFAKHVFYILKIWICFRKSMLVNLTLCVGNILWMKSLINIRRIAVLVTNMIFW